MKNLIEKRSRNMKWQFVLLLQLSKLYMRSQTHSVISHDQRGVSDIADDIILW